MKKIRILITLFAVLTILVGCKEQSDTFEVGGENVCVQEKGTQQCEEQASIIRLSVKEGKAVVQPISLPDNLGKISFPQFSKPAAFENGSYDLKIAKNNFTIAQGQSTLTAPTQPGILLRKNTSGQYQSAIGSAEALGPKHYTISENGYFEGLALRKATKVVYTAQRPTKGILLSSMYMYANGDVLSRVIGGDTGTEVVILDDFSPSSGDCDADAPEDCCPAGEGGGDPMLEIDEWVDDFAAQGDDLMACFKIGSICLFTDGSQLIILVCDSQVRYCLDFSICPVTVTTSSEFGICISVPLECGIPNPF